MNINAIKIFQLNVRGVSNVNKFNKICGIINVFKCKFDIIILTEVKLKTSFPVQLYNINGFERFTSLRSDQGGGGVIAFVNKDILVEESTSLSAMFEKLKLTLNINSSKLRLIAYYRAPTTSNIKPSLKDLEEEISASDMKTCVMGDININSYTLSVVQSPINNIDCLYEELLNSYGYNVSNILPTRPTSGRTIDHLATNFNNKLIIRNFTVEVDPCVTDHNMVITSIESGTKPIRQEVKITKTRTNYKRLCENFPDVSGEVLQSNDPDVIVKLITEATQAAMKKVTTTSNYVLKHTDKINDWTSEKTIKLILEKDKLLAKHRKKPGSEKIRQELTEVSKQLTKLTKTEYNDYVKRQVSTRDSKKLWKNLNNVLGRGINKTSAITLNVNGNEITDPKETADEFNRFFTTCAADLMRTQNSDDNREQYVEKQPQESMTPMRLKIR